MLECPLPEQAKEMTMLLPAVVTAGPTVSAADATPGAHRNRWSGWLVHLWAAYVRGWEAAFADDTANSYLVWFWYR